MTEVYKKVYNLQQTLCVQKQGLFTMK